MTVPTRLPAGLSIERVGSLFGNLRTINPFRLFSDVTDFADYIATDWTTTTSTGSTALVAGNGGLVTQTTAATGNDIQFNLDNPADIAFVPGSQSWFAVNVVLPDSLNPGAQFGLQTGGTPFAPTDGVYFTKVAASRSINLNIAKASVVSTLAGVATFADGVPMTLGFYYDGKAIPTLYVFANDVSGISVPPGTATPFGGQQKASAGALATSGVLLTNLPTANLSRGFGIQTASAAVKTMTTDFIGVMAEVAR